MVIEGIDTGDVEMRLVDAIRAVDAEFVRPEFLDVPADLVCPLDRNVFVGENGSTKLVAGFVCEDGRVFGVGEARIRVDVREEVFDVVFEIVDDGPVRVELLHERIYRRSGAADVDPAEAKEVEFAAVIVVVVVNQGCEDAQTVFAGLVDGPVDRIKCGLVEYVQLRFHREWIANTDAEGLGSDCVSTHRHECVHDFDHTALRRIRGIERRIKRLAFGWDNILVQPEPVHIPARTCPALAAEVEIAALSSDIAVAKKLFVDRLDVVFEDLTGDGCKGSIDRELLRQFGNL